MPIIKINGIEICYDRFGHGNAKTILLIAGLGSQMIRWNEEFCSLLAAKGFDVIRFDNRDAGCSGFIANEAKNVQELLTVLQSGRLPDGAYTLSDMAQDAIALLDYLNVAKAHIAGRSMGGIIAQVMASEFPERVLSLTAIMSTTLNPSLPTTRPDVMQLMLRPMADFSTAPELFKTQRTAFAKRISGSLFPFDEEEEWKCIQAEIKRAPAANITGQMCAMTLSGFDADRLARIQVPTLVIHGTEDPVFPVECGRDIASRIHNARLLEIEGMGHDIPKGLNGQITEAINRLTEV